MKTIAISDIIFATVRRGSHTLATLRLCGVTSLADVIRQIRQSLGRCAGMVTVMLRNGSQGWTESRAMILG